LASAASTLSHALTSEMSFNPPNSNKIVAEPAKQAFGNDEVLVEKGSIEEKVEEMVGETEEERERAMVEELVWEAEEEREGGIVGDTEGEMVGEPEVEGLVGRVQVKLS
jgi:hypothetical protein